MIGLTELISFGPDQFDVNLKQSLRDSLEWDDRLGVPCWAGSEDKILTSDCHHDHHDHHDPAPGHPPPVPGPAGPHQGEEGGGARHEDPEEVQETSAQHHGPGRHQIKVSHFVFSTFGPFLVIFTSRLRSLYESNEVIFYWLARYLIQRAALSGRVIGYSSIC